MVVKKAHKCFVVDEHGVEFIATTMGSGSQIIGHSNPLIKKIASKLIKEQYTLYLIITQRLLIII